VGHLDSQLICLQIMIQVCRGKYLHISYVFKAADLQNILENKIFQNITSNTYNSC